MHSPIPMNPHPTRFHGATSSRKIGISRSSHPISAAAPIASNGGGTRNLRISYHTLDFNRRSDWPLADIAAVGWHSINVLEDDSQWAAWSQEKQAKRSARFLYRRTCRGHAVADLDPRCRLLSYLLPDCATRHALKPPLRAATSELTLSRILIFYDIPHKMCVVDKHNGRDVAGAGIEIKYVSTFERGI